MQNAGARFQRTFADEPLLERLRLMPRDDLVDPDVRAKCNLLYRQWAVEYKNTQGMNSIATLYKQLPRTKKPQPSQSKVVRETEEQAQREEDSPPSSPVTERSRATSNAAATGSSLTPQRPVTLEKTEKSSSFFKSSKDKGKKGGKRKPFNLEKEKAKITETIGNANLAATNLYNALKLINREHQRVSENAECSNRFETCKVLRRQVLRYIQLVESEKYLGSLLSANDELVKALMAYEFMDKSIDADSDSDLEYESAKLARRTSGQGDQAEAFAQLSLNEATRAPVRPPRQTGLPTPPVPANVGKQRAAEPESESEPEEDEDDPFADRNAVKTPYVEKSGLTW